MHQTTEQALSHAATTPTTVKSDNPMRPLLSLPVPQAAAIIASMQLDKAHEAFLRLTHKPDSEALHDFRVGLRQMRSTFSAYPEAFPSLPRRLRKYMRQLARDTNHARDAEVQLDWLERNERQICMRGWPPPVTSGASWSGCAATMYREVRVSRAQGCAGATTGCLHRTAHTGPG